MSIEIHSHSCEKEHWLRPLSKINQAPVIRCSTSTDQTILLLIATID